MKLFRYTIFTFILGVLLMPSFSHAETIYIRNVKIELLTDGQAKISWNTNIPTSGMVLYSPDDSYRYTIGSSLVDFYNEVLIVNLKPRTTYNFKIIAKSGSETVTSFNHSFKTSTWKSTQPLTISDIRAVYIDSNFLTVRWLSDRESNSVLEAVLSVDYVTSGFSKRVKKISASGKVIKHQVTLGGLKPSSGYYYRVSSRDSDDNLAMSVDFFITTISTSAADKSDLQINNIAPASSPDPLINSNAVILIWQTNRPALGYIQFQDKNRGGVKGKIMEEGFATYDHRLMITGLNPRSSYAYKIYAADVLGKKLTTEERIFKTNPEPVVAGASTAVYSYSNLTPPPARSGYKHYTEVPRNLALEQAMAKNLRDFLKVRFGRVPPISAEHWFTLIKAFTYGGYPIEAIGQAVKYGGKTVHPAFFWNVWQNTKDYQNYISI